MELVRATDGVGSTGAIILHGTLPPRHRVTRAVDMTRQANGRMSPCTPVCDSRTRLNFIKQPCWPVSGCSYILPYATSRRDSFRYVIALSHTSTSSSVCNWSHTRQQLRVEASRGSSKSPERPRREPSERDEQCIAEHFSLMRQSVWMVGAFLVFDTSCFLPLLAMMMRRRKGKRVRACCLVRM